MSETKKSNPLEELTKEAKLLFFESDCTFEQAVLPFMEKAYDLGRFYGKVHDAASFGHQFECDDQE